MQNDLTEYFALLNFVGAGSLIGSAASFSRTFTKPIAAGFASDANPAEKATHSIG